jgi:hypothetical protein
VKNVCLILLMSSLSTQALAQAAPPPLKPVEFLEPDAKAAPATPEPSIVTTPAVAPKPAPVVVAEPKPEPKPVVIAQPAPVVISRPTPVVISQPAPPIAQPSAQGFNVGDQVATVDYWQGFVSAVYPNETADVRFTDGRILNFRIATLTKSVYTFGGFTIGQMVTTKKRKTGVIQYLFTNGTADVRFADKSRIMPLEKLSYSIAKLSGFTVGQYVVTDTNRTGQIVEIFGDETAKVRIGERTKTWKLSRLSAI